MSGAITILQSSGVAKEKKSQPPVLIECEEMAFTELKLYIDIGLCITALYHILSVSVTTTLILLTVLTLTLYTTSIHQHSFSPISLLEVANFKNS